MRGKKSISCFLLMLFSLVILFPGYGQSASKSKQTSDDISLSSVLKKCLSIGINNIVEEERSEEEDGNTENSACDFIMPHLYMHFKVSTGIRNHKQRNSMHANYSAEIICPPPNFLFS